MKKGRKIIDLSLNLSDKLLKLIDLFVNFNDRLEEYIYSKTFIKMKYTILR
ncbi:hypothetical protein [Helcococcus massiliensis]|uniref:hypothetical protein n=1 Tax=Helcococcus massiliensis TaxID=2040290 RepID=UPI0013564E56|nr:hypothetical protein [Helcococcus massiliensis]